jgi:hypothetical protein
MKPAMNLGFIKHFLIELFLFLCLEMFMLGNLQIKILKLLSENTFSILSLYDILAKENVKKIAFENSVKSLEGKGLICIEKLFLRLTENGKNMLIILESVNPLVTLKRKKVVKPRTKNKFIANLETTYHGKSLRYGIYDVGKSYKIISSRSKSQANYATVDKDTVEKIYHYLTKDTKRSASEIEKALHLSPTTIHNALKVLRVQKRADFEIFGKRRQFLYKAL